VTAALDLFEDPVYRDQIDFDFPVTFIAPSDARGELTEEELGQLFHDFNFTATPIQKGHAIDLDRSNLYIQAANKIGRIQTIRMAGGVEARAASLGKKSTALVAQQVLVRFTRGALEGTTFQDDAKKEIPDNPVTNATNVGERISQIEEYLDLIANEMGDQWKNHELLHLTAPGWNALGGVFHDIYVQLDDLLSKSQQEELTRKIGNIDWSRANQDFIGYLGDPVFVDAAGNKVRTPTERKQYSPDELSDWVGPDGKRLLGAIYGGRRGQTAYVEYIRRSIGLKPILASVASSTESDANLFENLHQDE
jgi:hypothetical protein